MSEFRDMEPQLPSNPNAESAVLGGLMFSPDALPKVQGWLKAEDFFVATNRMVFTAIEALAEKARPVDPVTVGDWFEAQGEENYRDLAAYAIEIGRGAHSAASIVAWAEIVMESSRRRRIIEIGQGLARAAMNPGGPETQELVARATSALTMVTPARPVGLQPYRMALKRFQADLMARHEGGAQLGIPTPWSGVNKAIGSLRDGEVIVLAARSNMGKSLLAFQLARFTALRGDRTAVFSMEMNLADVAARDVAAMGDVPLSFFTDQEKDEDYDINWTKTTAGIKAMLGANALIDDDPQLSAPQIVARARRAHQQEPLRLVVVDHLHEMALPGKQGEVIERGQALRDLKGLAKTLQCPVVVLAQLNRAAAAIGSSATAAAAARGGRPEIINIRGAGGIEEVADVVVFIHRPEFYNPGDRPGLVEVIVGKGRNIKTGTVVALRNRYEVMRAEDWDGAIPDAMEMEAPRERSQSSGLARRVGSRKKKAEGWANSYE